MILDVESLKTKLRQCTRVGSVLSQQENVELVRLQFSFKQFFDAELNVFLLKFPSASMLNYFSCDGWSRILRTTDVSKVGFTSITRRGRYRHDFDLQRGFIKGFGRDGLVECFPKFEEPLGMKFGKDGWHYLTALHAFAPSLRTFGYTDFCVNGGCFDGPLYGVLGRRMHALTHKRYRELPHTYENYILEITEWDVAARCVQHSCCNSVKAALDRVRDQLGPSLAKDDPFICIASVRNSASELLSHADEFVEGYTRFVEDKTSEFDRRAYWYFMNVKEPEIFEEFVLLNPFWDGHNFCVDNRFEGDWSSVRLRLVALLKYSLSFELWKDS